MRFIKASGLLALLVVVAALSHHLARPGQAVKPPVKAASAAAGPGRVQPATLPPTPRMESKATMAQAASADALVRFAEWTRLYLAAQDPALVAEGLRLAEQRRPVFKQMIQDNPREALQQAVSMVVRQQLPPEIVSRLEERVAARGELRVYGASPEAQESGEKPFLRYAATRDGRTFEAHVFGRREFDYQQKADLSLIGVALDGELALSESPVRRLEAGEVPPADKKQVEVCPVSGLSTEREAAAASQAVPETVAAVETGDEIVFLCDGAHIAPYENGIVMAEGGSGGALGFTGPMPSAAVPSVGVVKVLYVPALFADQGQVPASEATMLDGLRQAADFYQTQSYGRLTLVATVTPPVRLPRNQAWYVGKDTTSGFIKEIDGLNAEMQHAKEAARAAGYDWQDYHCFCVRANGGARSPTSYGSIGAGQVWMRSDSASTIAHEVGHAFGLTHANFWLTNGASVAGPGGNEEYGDIFDNMGGTSPPTGHYNAQAKNQVRWMPPEFAPPITASGRYRVYAFDTPRLVPGRLYGLQVRKDYERTFWGEYRTLFPSNVWAANGLILGWKWSNNNGDNIQLLDTTPGSINGKTDCPIALGSTFSDTESGIHITTISADSATSPPSLEVQVNLGSFPGNQAPVLSLNPASPVVPASTSITFTATASDPDGDTLSYSWRWHDSVVSPNSPTVTRSFSTSGVYTVSCVVSDMKGGIAVRNALITVGNGGSRFAIRGRITLNGSGLPGVNVTTSGTNGTLTDSDGYYAISSLAAGTYTVTPAGHGLQFNELFNNSITVGPSFSGADFTIDPLPVVSLSTPVAVAQEGSSPVAGKFRLTRTGSTALPLTVYTLVVRGTATKGTDYTFSPDYTAAAAPYFAFTIPADSDTLDILVTPSNDAASEGNESVDLILGMDTSYVNGTPASATVTVQDDDTALPRVSLTSAVTQVVEGAGQPISCTVSRSGATTSDLVVTYAVGATSTATSGTDYTALSGTVTIPSGSASATFAVTPVDDSLPEATESVRLSIATGAAFIADAAASSLVLNLVDDDNQIISVSVTDAVATEADRAQPGVVPDPGIFLLTRSGDTSAPLTVYYSVAGVALHGADYEALPGSVIFPAGVTQRAITIMPRFDGFGEGSETVMLSIADGNDAYRSSSTASSGTVTINDHASDKPLLEVIASGSIAAEPSTNGQFRITAKGGSGSLAVNYQISGTATAGSDYTISGLDNVTLLGSATVTLNGGTAVQNLTITTVNDALAEDLENIVITLLPSASYVLWDQSKTATHLLRDDDQPTVFVDPQIGTSITHAISETSTATTLKFFFSRTGSTTSALTVNYTLVGTATNGTDHSNLGGTVTIPVGASGADVSFNTIADSTFEGTETVTVRLSAGSYARGPDATIYILDDDAGSQTVNFASSGGSGSESVTSVDIPVTLSAPATAPVSVDYLLETGPRTPTMLSGLWLRVIRTANSYSAWYSFDGVNFTQQGATQTISGMATSGYLAGIYVTSGTNGTLGSMQVDNFSVTGLEAGGSAGTMLSAAIGAESPPGGFTESGGLYNIICGGPDLSATGTTDGGRMVYVPITGSANCTVTARVLGFTGGSSSMKAGVMIRESTTNNVRHMTSVTEPGLAMRRASYRLTAGGNAGNSNAQAIYSKPRWLRLQRSGQVFTAFVSNDGLAWTVTGVAPAAPLGSLCLVGLAASARQDGLITQAVFDNVTLSTGGTLTGRTIGYVNEPGLVLENSGTWTLNASGAGFMPTQTSTEDEGHMAGASVSGDFTLTARIVSLSGGASTAQAGLMVRETSNYRARALWFGLPGTGATTSAPEFRARLSATSSGEGRTVDYQLIPGTLTFGIGEQTKNINLSITNDLIPEPVEFATILLRYPYGALAGSPASYTYAILDDDAPLASLPVLGFAGAVSSGSEASTPAVIPVVLNSPASLPVTVDYAVTGGTAAGGGADFTQISGTLSFAPGEVMQYLQLPVTNDSAAESQETVVLTLSNATNAVLSSSTGHTFTIQDDDTPVVTVTASTPQAFEGGDSGVFTFARTGGTGADLTVNFTVSGTATSGSDFTAFTPASSVVIPAGQASATLTVAPLQNTTAEVNETVIVTLGAGSGYNLGSPSAATVTIVDDDVNTVTLTATDAVASEAAGNPGEFTLTRTGPLTSSLNVTLSITGTATNGTDYTTITTSRTFGVGVSSITVAVTPIQDSSTEGDEEVIVSIATSSGYIVGSPSVANVTLVDDDLPPTVYVSNPAGKSTIISAANGLLLQAVGSDDGLPNPLSYTWSQIFGPGTITFGSAGAADTSATFSAAGVYGLRVTVDDGQFTASDSIVVQVGGFAFANWIGMDQGPPGVRGISGESSGGQFTLIGSGTGFSGTNDSGHMMFRQLLGGTGDCSLTARLVSFSGPATRLAGITIRDTSWKGARRTNFVLDGGGTLQFRTRGTMNTADSAVTSTGLSSPLWLKLERVGGSITASSAPDAGGSPGAWTQLGSPTSVTMGTNVCVGMVVSSGASTNATTTAIFDNVSVTPAFTGSALHSEDLGNYTTAGSSSESAGTITVTAVGTHDTNGGHFRYQQVWGDCIVTARLTSHSGATRGAQSGVGIRDTTDNGAFGFYGTTTIDGFQSHWRSTPGGGTGALQTGGAIGNWIRLVRKGNNVAAFRASNVGGAPGTWSQVTGNLPASLTGPLLVGVVVDSNTTSTTDLGIGTFTNLSIEPLNTAPVVNPGTVASLGPFLLNGSVTDDGRPTPPGAFTTSWAGVSGPGPVSFANPQALQTAATLSQSGAYRLRLYADDGDTVTFADLAFNGYMNSYDAWRDASFTSGLTNPAAEAGVDPDGDGLLNLLEYAFGSRPDLATGAPVTQDIVLSGGERYLRLTVPKNPSATDVSFEVEATGTVTDSGSWSSAGLVTETNSPTVLVVRDAVPLSSASRRFMRVKVLRP